MTSSDARPELPTGTVTFLFTDIEGSTRLLHELGDRYAEVLAEHRRVLRDAFAAHGGVEVDTQGDAFFVAFPRATDAVASAVEAQEALAAGPVRVRMGVHTGEPSRTDEGYVGMDVHRAARIAAAGHGGQVLVSQSTRDLLDEQFELRDLGEHRLKDLAAPQRLFQLGEGEFPPLKSLYQTNLPVVATPFLGREREVSEVLDLLHEARLVTLTGPGGTGKTRLGLQAAAEAAQDFEDGVFWVGLAPLRDPELVVPTIAQAVGARDEAATHIGEKRMLLLVDNFEQVVEAAPPLGELLLGCPSLKLLVTSREPLHLEGEWEYAVQPLREAEAVALFEQRARAINPDFSPNGEVAKICARLDCLPLAVELAAARVKVLSPAAILERLEQRLPLLTGGARNVPERQRTLRATIEWSYELLTPEEQQLFARLAVFAGGCTLEAAEQVCEADLDTLQSLVDKSLVRHSNDRYWMLETIREYALEGLHESGEGDRLRRRHVQYFVDLSEAARPQLLTRAQRQIVKRLAEELDNLRQAISWSLVSAPEAAVSIASALEDFWLIRGHLVEARRWLELGLARGAVAPTALRARALGAAAYVALRQGDPAATASFAEEGLALARKLQDIGSILTCLTATGVVAEWSGELERAELLYREGVELARAEDERAWLSALVSQLGLLELARENFAAAAELLQEALRLCRELGDDWNSAIGLANLGLTCLRLGRQNAASRKFSEALELSASLGNPEVIANALLGLAAVELSPERAIRLLGASDRLRELAGAGLHPIEQKLFEQTSASLQERVGEDSFAQAWAGGRSRSVDEAVAYGLESID